MSYTAVTGATFTAAQFNTNVRDVLDAHEALFNAMYYVGIVIEAVVSTNPADLLGFGTWVAFGSGRVTVGRDAGQTEFDTVEETGGAKTHTLTTTEIPSHTHSVDVGSLNTQNVADGGNNAAYNLPNAGNTGSAGSGGAHNNLQPYIVVYRWKRTA